MNLIAEVSHEVARTLGQPNHADYTFHSFRRSSAAADDGASAQQLISFYGWESFNMPQEYISTSKRAVMNMASLSSNPVENSINVEVKISEITENPANIELETSLEPKPSTIKGSLVLQETAFFGT